MENNIFEKKRKQPVQLNAEYVDWSLRYHEMLIVLLNNGFDFQEAQDNAMIAITKQIDLIQ